MNKQKSNIAVKPNIALFIFSRIVVMDSEQTTANKTLFVKSCKDNITYNVLVRVFSKCLLLKELKTLSIY